MARTILIALTFLLVSKHEVYSQVQYSDGGGFSRDEQLGQCLSENTRTIHLKEALEVRNNFIDSGVIGSSNLQNIVSFEWPLNPISSLPGKFPGPGGSSLTHYDLYSISNYVDHDSSTGNLSDFSCGTRTYDTDSGYDHRGTDYFSWPFDHHKSLFDHVEVVSAAPGVIIQKFDGNADNSCSLNSNSWNAVYVSHADGSIAWYGHLKNGSLTSKEVGASVDQGEFLGIMASSGNSTGPHLHFEVYDTDLNLIDPYEGSCNLLNTDSWWADQRGYWNSGINALGTHVANPNFASCPQVETINDQDIFKVCEEVFLVTYFRDEQEGQSSTWTIRKPNGTVWTSWNYDSENSYYASWRSFSTDLPCDADLGDWTFEVDYEGQIYRHDFLVTSATDVGISEESIPTGISSLELFPNPARSSSRIEFVSDFDGSLVVKLRNILGQQISEVFRGQVSRNGTVSIPLDLSLEVPGTYFVEVVGPNVSALRKVVLLE